MRVSPINYNKGYFASNKDKSNANFGMRLEINPLFYIERAIQKANPAKRTDYKKRLCLLADKDCSLTIDVAQGSLPQTLNSLESGAGKISFNVDMGWRGDNIKYPSRPFDYDISEPRNAETFLDSVFRFLENSQLSKNVEEYINRQQVHKRASEEIITRRREYLQPFVEENGLEGLMA